MEQAKSLLSMEEIRKLWDENYKNNDYRRKLLDLVKRHFKAGNPNALNFLRSHFEFDKYASSWHSSRDEWFDWFIKEGLIDPRDTSGRECKECGVEAIYFNEPDWDKWRARTGYSGEQARGEGTCFRLDVVYCLKCGHIWGGELCICSPGGWVANDPSPPSNGDLPFSPDDVCDEW